MKKLFKWMGIIIGSLIGLIAVAYFLIVIVSNGRINQSYAISVDLIEIPDDIESLNNGEHVATIRGCMDCHGEDLSGKLFIDEPPMGTLYATNLTKGDGGVSEYSDEDWIKTIRHGIGIDDKPLIFMPSHEYYYLNDSDLGDLIAYLKSIPAIDKTFPEPKVGPLARVLHLAGQFDLLPAELIAHSGSRPIAPVPAVSVEYGEYMSVGCIGCHGRDFKGGKIKGVPPDWPKAADITSTGSVGSWTKDEFFTVMRTGEKPNGERLTKYMPFQAIGQATDAELEAMWLYLVSIP